MDDVVIYATGKVQNTARIYRQRHADSTYSSPSATQWLRKSHYTNEMIIDEETVIYCKYYVH